MSENLHSIISELLTMVAREIDKKGCIYGVEYENDAFVMHPYCQCGKQSCPLCISCTCPPEAYHYFYKGKEVPLIEFDVERWEGMPEKYNVPDYYELKRKWHEKNAKCLEIRKDKTLLCSFCRGTAFNGLFGLVPGRGAPNFWHKPSGLRIWWYKHIGRGMVYENLPLSPKDFVDIICQCLKSLDDEEE